MGKKPLSQDQKMTDVASFVETDPDKILANAKTWAAALIRRAKSSSGDKNEIAMETAARWAGVPTNTIWALRYRPPGGVDATIYNRLQVAYAKYCESLEGQIAANLAELRGLPSTPAHQRLIAEMEKFLGVEAGAQGQSSPLNDEAA